MFELKAETQMGLRIASTAYNSSLFSIDSRDLLPSSQPHFAPLNSKLFSLDEYVLSPV